MSHVTCMTESCHTQDQYDEWMNLESCHTQLSHVPHEGVMSHIPRTQDRYYEWMKNRELHLIDLLKLAGFQVREYFLDPQIPKSYIPKPRILNPECHTLTNHDLYLIDSLKLAGFEVREYLPNPSPRNS